MSSTQRIPPLGYRSVRGLRTRAIVREEVAAWVADRLSREQLSKWAASVEGAKALRGRGTVYVVPHPEKDDGARWAVRHAYRGGAMAGLLGDRYARLGRPRPVTELLASETARERGVRTPRVVAVAWYPSGPWYTADVVTEHVGDCRTLADRVFSEGRERPASELLKAAGRTAARLAKRGVRHPDLNAMNLLVPNDPSDDQLWVLDFDGAVVDKRIDGTAMLSRLARSLRRHGESSGRPLDTDEVEALRNGFLEKAHD